MSLVDEVYFYVKRKIVENELAPGCPIVEMDITKKLNVSRTPIREALSKLEKEGFVKKYPGKGIFVSIMSYKRVIEIFEFRKIIESNIISLIIDKIPIESIIEVEKELEEIKNEKPFNVKKAEEAGRRAHNLIYNYYNSELLNEIFEKLTIEKNMACHLLYESENTASKLLDQHLQILNELKNKNAKNAKSIMLEHFEFAKKNLLSF